MDDSRIRSCQRQAAELTDELKELTDQPLPKADSKEAGFSGMQLSYRIGRYEDIRRRAGELCDRLSEQENASESVRMTRVMLEGMMLTADRQIEDLGRLKESYGQMSLAVEGNKKAESLLLNERLKQALKREELR